jgi:hypothetical protein
MQECNQAALQKKKISIQIITYLKMASDMKQNVLGRTNHLLSCDATQTAYKMKKKKCGGI